MINPQDALNKKVEFSNDRVIRAVQEANIAYKNNSNYQRLRTQSFGRVMVHPVTFTGENNWAYTNYVIDKGGDESKPLTVIKSLSELFANSDTLSMPFWYDSSLLKVYALIGLALLLAIASILLAWNQGQAQNASIPLFTGLLGSIIGYLIGDRQQDKRP